MEKEYLVFDSFKDADEANEKIAAEYGFVGGVTKRLYPVEETEDGKFGILKCEKCMNVDGMDKIPILKDSEIMFKNMVVEEKGE